MSNLKNKSLEEIKKIKAEDISNEIKKISDILKNYNTDILFNEEIQLDILSKEVLNQLDQISSTLKSTKFTTKDVKFLAKYLKIIEIFAKKTISENNFVYLYPISIIFYMLRLEPNFLTQIVGKDIFSKIIEIDYNYFLKIENTFNVPIDTSYYEKDIFKRYLNGVKKDNIFNVYSFVESVERGNGNYTNYFMSFLARILFSNPEKYFSFLELLTQPFTLDKYLNIIENKLENKFLETCLSSNNNWLIFGYLRQLIQELNPTVELSKDEINSISKLFGKLYLIDEDFFISGILFLAKYQNKKCLGYCIGMSLSNINEKDLLKKSINRFGINQNAHNLDLWTYIAKALKNENEELLECIGQIIFNKWVNFLKKLFNSDKLESSLIYTDYLDIIIYFLAECLEKNKSKFLELLEKKLDIIINYKSFWVKYSSQKRFIYLSYVYCMSEAWKIIYDSEIDVIAIKNKINFIIDDKRLYLSLRDNGISHKKILKIKENFGIQNG